MRTPSRRSRQRSASSSSTLPPWNEPAPPGDGGTTVEGADGGRVRLRHARFLAEIDAFGGSARLYRRTDLDFALALTLRTALVARLPAVGGLPLHAAGLVLEGAGVAFFGVSGAGKSTLAALAPGAVLSDELVAVVPGAPFSLAASGHWGTLQGRARTDIVPLRALVELAKGPSFRLERLGPREAVRRLAGVTMVPPSPALWNAALAVAGRLVTTVPVYRMTWSPEAPPWEELSVALRAR